MRAHFRNTPSIQFCDDKTVPLTRLTFDANECSIDVKHGYLARFLKEAPLQAG